MGSGSRNHHHHDLQIAVAVAVDQNFLIFGGRFGHQRRGPTLLLSENWERLNRSVAACVGRPSTATATAIWLHIAVAIEIAVVDGALKRNPNNCCYKGIGYLQVLFFIIKPRSLNFGLEISLRPQNNARRRPTAWYKDLSPLGLHSRVRAHFKEEELLYHVTLSFFLISI